MFSADCHGVLNKVAPLYGECSEMMLSSLKIPAIIFIKKQASHVVA